MWEQIFSCCEYYFAILITTYEHCHKYWRYFEISQHDQQNVNFPINFWLPQVFPFKLFSWQWCLWHCLLKLLLRSILNLYNLSPSKLYPSYIGSTIWIMFCHSSLSWVKFSDWLHFFLSNHTTFIHVLFGLFIFRDGLVLLKL